MPKIRERCSIEVWGDRTVAPGESRDLELKIAESYSGMTMHIPMHVRRGKADGPVVFVTAAVHGDEINGTGAVRSLILDETFHIDAGAVILIPVVNLLGFDRHSRYLPDRRDLNRCFPGSARGSLASRMARIIFDEVVSRCDYGIDLHTASVRRTNFPNVRADLTNPKVRRIAEAFGSEVILAGKGPKGSFRREASAAGCPTIILEAGEVWKVERGIVEYATRGIRNVLIELGMCSGEPALPAYQTIIERSKWIRSEKGGFLQFHVSPGEMVTKGQPVATNTSLLGRENNTLLAPFGGFVLGMTTLPATTPGEPVFNIGQVAAGIKRLNRIRGQLATEHPHERMRDDLATNVHIVEHDVPESNSQNPAVSNTYIANPDVSRSDVEP